jgi:phage tail sheath protein FI
MADYKAPGVYIEEFEMGARPIEGVSTSIAGFVGKAETGDLDKATEITSWADFTKKFGVHTAKAPHLAPAVYGFFLNGGNRCYVVRVKEGATDGDYTGTDGGPGKRTGLQAFKEIDEVNIVCIPGLTSKGVQKSMIDHCELMKDRVAVLDAQQGADPTKVKTQKTALSSDKGFAGLYYPWIKAQYETKKGNKVELADGLIPPSGHIAGIYARSDSERGVHKAPANEIVRGALDLECKITKAEQEGLNPEGVNCIRFFPGRGIRVWGARTIAPKSSNWKYVNVRRLFLYLEESIEESTQWVVFEPNDEKLWARVKQTITQFLTRVWRDGALMGKAPEEAFFVKCDRTTMMQDDIDNGRLIVIIGVAPVKPAEFVIFRIAQWRGGSEVSE